MARGIPSFRPAVMGATHAVSAGHYLAAAAGYRLLEQGGNAIDAGVAGGIAINVVLPHLTNFGGVAPTILHHAASGETITIDGLGRWPKAATLDRYLAAYGGDIPEGIPRTVTPAAPDAWLTALELYGTVSFEQAVTPALQLAEDGFPVHPPLHRALTGLAAKAENELAGDAFRSTRDTFLPGGAAPAVGQVLMQPELARTFRRMIDVERSAAGRGREGAIQAVREFFYQGEVAEAMAAFSQDQGGLLTRDDLAAYRVKLEPPAVGSYKGVDVYTCGPWCQGPVTIETLHILEGLDLQAMGHNSPDYLHALLEALKLSFADRHSYYGDPDFVSVPLAGLLSKEYAALRRAAIAMERATPEMPAAGDPWAYQPGAARRASVPQPTAVPGDLQADTSYLCVVDRWGNAFSATPSDGVGSTPLVPGLGFILSSRGSQTWLDPQHPCVLEPGKRPRLTPNPAMAFRDGKVAMPFGTPGGDVQCQSMVQLFLNVFEFGMDAQQAIEAPRISTWSFPNSFWPHAYPPGLVCAEGRMPAEALAELERRGHRVEVWDDWAGASGNVCAIESDPARGIVRAGADPRREAYAIAR